MNNINNNYISKKQAWDNINQQIISFDPSNSHYPPDSIELSFYKSFFKQKWPEGLCGKKILVLGATFEFIKLGLENGLKVFCIDFSNNRIDSCKNRLEKLAFPVDKNVTFDEKNWLNADYENQRFDIIIGDCALSNLYPEDVKNLLTKLSEWLKHDGILFLKEIIVPNDIVDIAQDDKLVDNEVDRILDCLEKGQMSVSQAYTYLRFYISAVYQLKDTECQPPIQLRGKDAFDFLKKKLEKKKRGVTLYEYILKHENNIEHTLFTKESLYKEFMNSIGQPKVFDSPLHKVFKIFVFDKSNTLHDYSYAKTTSKYKESYLHNKDYAILSYIGQILEDGGFDFAQLAILHWGIGTLNNVKEGKLEDALVYFIPYDLTEDLKQYITSMPIYSLLDDPEEKWQIKLADYLFQERSSIHSLYASLTQNDKIDLHLTADCLRVAIPVAAIQEILENPNFQNIKSLVEKIKFNKKTLYKWNELSQLPSSIKNSINTDTDIRKAINNLNKNFTKIIDKILTPETFKYKPIIGTLVRIMLFGFNSPFKPRHLYFLTYPVLNIKADDATFTGVLCFTQAPLNKLIFKKIEHQIYKFVTSRSIWNFGKRVFDEVMIHSMKAAIAAIMSRNMSHNIGSHVLAKVSSKKPENDKWPDWGKDFQILSQYLQQRQDFIAQIATEWPKWTYPTWLMKDLMRWFLSQKHLLNYIASSEGLKAHFYDNNGTNENDVRIHVLKSCKKIWDRKITEEVFKNSNGSSGLKKWTEIINAICSYNCDKCNDCALQKQKICSSDNNTGRLQLLFTDKDDLNCCLDEDIQLAIPGGIIGNHAFYTILENVIRNGAKHSFTKMKKMQEENSSDEKLEIAFGAQEDIHMDVVIEFMDEDEGDIAENKYSNYYRFRIYDNVSFVSDNLSIINKNEYLKPLLEKDILKLKELYDWIQKDKSITQYELLKRLETIYGIQFPWNGEYSIPKNIVTDIYNSLPVNLNRKLQSDLITDEGELQKGNWGLAEMKISAGYLQKRDILEIGMGGGKVTRGDNFIIKAAISPLGTLAYEFRLPKPKEVGIVCKKD